MDKAAHMPSETDCSDQSIIIKWFSAEINKLRKIINFRVQHCRGTDIVFKILPHSKHQIRTVTKAN